MRLLASLLCLALALGACNTGFEPQYRVLDLRLLAIRSHPAGSGSADVRLGDTLALEALFANPLARPGLTVTWYGCVPQPSELLPPCADPEFLAHPERLAAAAAQPAASRIVELLGTCQPAGEPDRCGVTVALPQPARVQAALDFVLSLAAADPAFRCRLYAELPVVAVVEAGGRRAPLALKRVRVLPTDAELEARGLKAAGEAQDVNLNPRIFSVERAPTDPQTCGGATPVDDPGGFPAGRTVLCGLSADAPQDYWTCGPGGREAPRALEQYAWQWYVSAGEFPEEGGVGNATGGEIDFVRPPGPFQLWTIVRDGRGGVDWRRHDLGAAP